VVVVGAGPVGLATAIDLAQKGVPVVLLDDDNKLSNGSRAICFSKRTLEIFDRLGCGERMAAKGVRWHVGRVFNRRGSLQFRPAAGNRARTSGLREPAAVLRRRLSARAGAGTAAARPALVQQGHGLTQHADLRRADVTRPTANTSWKRICRRSRRRQEHRAQPDGPGKQGRTFRDRFLIADVKMTADFPAERWFWFDPPFHPGQSVLLHRQPDNIWRIDFQLGWDADPVAEKAPERVIPRIQALLGKDAGFTLEWVSIYTFCCLRMDSFRHGRVLFAGDAAHGVSPFGARGANSGVQDADNLAWKLRLVVKGKAPDTLLDTYASERELAADENILNSTRSTDFITPKSAVSKLFRDAVLQLAKDQPFARKLVNSGRLSGSPRRPASTRPSTAHWPRHEHDANPTDHHAEPRRTRRFL
jgi:3-(3-hydroxy-phenyl)propionate hydroxylase